MSLVPSPRLGARAARRILLAVVLLAAGLAAHVPAAGAAPSPRSLGYGSPLYADGQDGRYLLSGPWLFRSDPLDQGIAQGLAAQTTTLGWTPTRVPNAWNGADAGDASMAGSIGFYRRDFRLPDTARRLSWIVRFESVNYRATVWLNGRLVGTHTGAFVPWELRLTGLHRTGVNRLVIRVDSRHTESDLPPNRDTGWWNYGGMLREVYLRRVDRLDIASVDVRPRLPCPTCASTVPIRATVRSYAHGARTVHLTGSFGSLPLDLGTRTLDAGATATFTGRVLVRRPRMWSPADPHLYRVSLTAGKDVAYHLHTGIRSVTVRHGRLYLNGRAVHFRGVGLHEDSPTKGAAIGLAERTRILRWIEGLGATFVRAHYPLSPEFEEIADHHGILLWSEVPVYHLPEPVIARRSVQDAGLRMLRENIAANGDHASIITWSVGNELDATVGAGQARYLARAAALVHRLDPSRPAALAMAGHPASGCQTAAYAPLDLIGINDYFGWYTAEGTIADRDFLSGYLDAMRGCYPRQALAVTEFGSEANRDGPVEEKGTYEFQDDFIRYHMRIYARKPWLAGVDYWALQEFRVHPGWSGGNPRPDPPLHEKGLVSFFGKPKPAYAVVSSLYRTARQYGRWRPADRRAGR